MNTARKFLLGGSLLVILVLSAASNSQAQSTTLSQGDVEHADFHDDPHATPEPVTMLLFGTGLVGAGIVAKLRKKRQE